MKNLVPLILVLLLVGSGGMLVVRVFRTAGSFSLPKIDVRSLIPPTPKPTLPLPMPTPSPRTTVAPTRKPSPVPTKKPVVVAPTRPPANCQRVTVPHLDGSSSNLCYSQTDAQALLRLKAGYDSAENFYRFHLDGVDDYQKQYERTGSKIYLDAKQSQLDKANGEKAEMGQIALEMYAIEQRGW